MLIQGQVGPIASSTSLSAGVQATARMDNLGGLTATQLLPRYYETTYRRQMYTAATLGNTPVATTSQLTQAYTGLCIANPTTSTINVVVTKVGYSSIVQQTNALAVGLMTGVGASITAAITPRNRFVGGVGSQCLASTSLTLPAVPVLETILGTIHTGALNLTGVQPMTNVDLEGSLILPPGAFVAFYTSAASAATSMHFSFQWVEVPL